MQLFERLDRFRHEQVVFTYLHDAGLKAIIAIHDTTLGPALGGVRMWPYASDDEALEDALRLARGMTYKAAAAGLNLGGGKAVIIGDPRKDKSELLFRAFGKAVNTLGGRYITAEDVGTNVLDMEYISRETPYVTGVDTLSGGSGDPSPFTAFGVFQGMKAAAERAFGDASLQGRTVAVQGLGNVGTHLSRLLVEEGAQVLATDIHPEKCEALKANLPSVEIVAADSILSAQCDILAPCALGGVVNDDTLPNLKCRVIAGAANNQLKTEAHGRALAEQGILYAPDYVINSGGLMNVYQELKGYNRERAYRVTQGILPNTRRIFDLAESQGIPTSEAANQLAVQRMKEIGRLSTCFNRFPRVKAPWVTPQTTSDEGVPPLT